jgi:hypothetical protein
MGTIHHVHVLNTKYRYKERKCCGLQKTSLLCRAWLAMHLERRATSIVRVETPYNVRQEGRSEQA